MKTLTLLLALPFVCIQSFGQNCATLVSPANNQQLVPLIYDDVVAVPSGRSNGVELKWRKTDDPMYIVIKVDGACCWEAIQNTGNSGWGPPFTSDTSIVAPIEYGTKYQWFLTTNYPVSPCNPASVYSFTTAPPPPYCNPGCVGVYSQNYEAFSHKIPGNNNVATLFDGLACLVFTPAGPTIAELAQGRSYPLLLWSENSTNYTLWIDLNDNGYFENTERLIYSAHPYFPQNYWEPVPNVFSMYIPGNAPVGTHRFRIKTGNGEDACKNPSSLSDGFIKIVPSNNNFYGLSQPGSANTCITVSSGNISSKSNNNTDWLPLVDASGNVLASIKANGNDLGAITVKLYVNNGPIRIKNGREVLDRSVEIKPEFQPVSPVDVRIYFSQAEFNALKAADPSITSLSDLGISKFTSGCGEQLAGYSYNGNTTTGSINGFHYIQFSTTSFSDFYIRLRAELLQPVHFLSVHAKRESGNTIIIWETATEQNNQGFEVEYSKDGMAFKTLSFVASKANGGNSNAAISYRYVHVGSPVIAGYYRIKQIDKDGSARYSQVMSIYALTDKLVISKIFPNPATDKVLLQLYTTTPQDVQIQLSTLAGVVLKNSKSTLIAGQNKAEIVVAGLPAGVYLLTVKDDNGRKLEQAKISKW